MKYLLSLLFVLANSAFAQGPAISGDQGRLQGLWQQNCEEQVVRSEKFEQSKEILTESFYADDDCEVGLLQLISESTFALPASEKIDFTFKSVRAVINNVAMVNYFNNNAVCGFQDWKLKEEKEISGQVCKMVFNQGNAPQKIPAAGDSRHDTYRFEDDQLYLGDLIYEKAP